MDGFQVKKGPQEFVIPDGSLEQLLSVEEQGTYDQVPAEFPASGSRTVILYILPSAFEELNREIQWRASTRQNQREQGGILVGRVFRNSQDQVCGAVEHIIPSIKSGTATYIQFSHDDWIAMYREFDEKYAAREDSTRLSIIGWYHTHPNMPVRMSSIDKNTHTSFFSKAWQFSAIFNPQKGIWSGFNGNECANCAGILFCTPAGEKGAEPPQIEQDVLPGTEPEEPPEVPSSSSPPACDQSAERGNGGDFVIHRRTDRPADTHRAVRSPSGIGGTSGQKFIFKERYEGDIFISPRGSVRYYCPINASKLDGKESYVISEELVQQLSAAEHLHLSEDETVALIYHLGKSPFMFSNGTNRLGKTIQYYTFKKVNRNTKADIIYHAGDDRVAAYGNSGGGDTVPLAVVFSRTCPSYKTLLKRYQDCCCALWVDKDNKNEIAFYALGPYSAEDRFRVVQSSLESVPANLISEVDYGKILGHALSRRGTGRMGIRPKLVSELLRKAASSGSIPHGYCIILEYETVSLGRNKWTLEPYRFTGAALLTKRDDHQWTLCARLPQIYSSEPHRLSRFSFILSNRDIQREDIYYGPIGYQLTYCQYAVSVNIESLNRWYFYEL